MFFTGEFAYQRNDTIDLEARAGRVSAGYSFANAPCSPYVAVGHQTFSGDDPDTTRLEWFDPLYCLGNPSAWATGSKSASTFVNSNVNLLALSLRGEPALREAWALRHGHIRANEFNSTIQFGQASRVNVDGNVVSGVTDPHLPDEIYLEFNGVITGQTFLTAGLSVSFPGSGVDNVIGERADPWTGGFFDVVVNF